MQLLHDKPLKHMARPLGRAGTRSVTERGLPALLYPQTPLRQTPLTGFAPCAYILKEAVKECFLSQPQT